MSVGRGLLLVLLLSGCSPPDSKGQTPQRREGALGRFQMSATSDHGVYVLDTKTGNLRLCVEASRGGVFDDLIPGATSGDPEFKTVSIACTDPVSAGEATTATDPLGIR